MQHYEPMDVTTINASSLRENWQQDFPNVMELGKLRGIDACLRPEYRESKNPFIGVHPKYCGGDRYYMSAILRDMLGWRSTSRFFRFGLEVLLFWDTEKHCFREDVP